MIVDSGVWIDHFTGRVNEAVGLLRRALEEDADVYLLPTILQEVLQGTRDAGQLGRYAKLLAPLPMAHVPDWRRAASRAADLYAQLRRRGITVPPTDCLIAACVLASRIPLLTTDADFRPIAAIQPRLRLIGA